VRPFWFVEWLCECLVVWLKRWAFVELLELGGRLAIVVSLAVFVWGYRESQDNQRRAKHYQAWQVINLAHGKSGSGGRAEALEDLAGDQVSLARINLDWANLRGVNLDWANLRGIDLRGADLTAATFQRADLRGARVDGAELRSANLSAADLGGADLSDATLTGANLERTDLTRADLSDAGFEHADLTDADLLGADLRGVEDLPCSALLLARNWEGARGPAGLRRAHPSGPEVASAGDNRVVAGWGLLIVLAVGVGGCVSFQAYPGPPRPSSETAIVQGETKMLVARHESLHIVSINGATSLGEWTSDAGARPDVLPGEYTFGVSDKMLGTSLIGIMAQMGHSSTLAKLAFQGEAGYRYLIQFDLFDPDTVGDGPYFVTRSPIDATVFGAPPLRVSCEPRKALDYLDLVCPF
jgi:uncharacterized protein YjbI with pentapeptide repeats